MPTTKTPKTHIAGPSGTLCGRYADPAFCVDSSEATCKTCCRSIGEEYSRPEVASKGSPVDVENRAEAAQLEAKRNAAAVALPAPALRPERFGALLGVLDGRLADRSGDAYVVQRYRELRSEWYAEDALTPAAPTCGGAYGNHGICRPPCETGAKLDREARCPDCAFSVEANGDSHHPDCESEDAQRERAALKVARREEPAPATEINFAIVDALEPQAALDVLATEIQARQELLANAESDKIKAREALYLAEERETRLNMDLARLDRRLALVNLRVDNERVARELLPRITSRGIRYWSVYAQTWVTVSSAEGIPDQELAAMSEAGREIVAKSGKGAE